MRKARKKNEIKRNQKIRQIAKLNEDEYTIFIIPQEINVKDNLYRFLIEIHRAQGEEVAELVSTELLVKKEVLWNYRGPLAVGFFFPNKVYFLTFTIWASWSSWGPRLSSGLWGVI